MKGVEIEYFTLCIALRKVIFFIYQKINSSDRVPLSLDTILEGGELLLTQYLNAGGVIDPTVQVDKDVSVVGGRPRELGAVQ